MTDTLVAPDAAPTPATAAGRRTFWLLLALVVVRFVALGAILASHQEAPDSQLGGDVHRYEQMTTSVGVPYRDFQIEYPPVTYALLRVTHLESPRRTVAAVAVWSLAFDLGTAAVLARAWNRRTALSYLVLGTPLVLFPFIYLRIDLLSVFLAVLGLGLARRRLDLPAGAALALAVLAKVWPFAVAPALLVERKVRGLVAAAVTGAGLLAFWVLQAGPAGVQQVVSFRDATGWQIESLPGILWHLRDPSRVKFESGAFRTGVMADWARPTLTLISLGFIAAAWVLAERRRRAGSDDTVVYGYAPLASVLALLIFAPILSPQYVVWMLPFVAVVGAAGDRRLEGAALAVTAITTVSYGLVFSEVSGAWYGTVPVLVRNLVLVAMLVWALQALARRPASTSSSAPVPVTASPSA